MDFKKVLNIELGNAICYSGYREGQSPKNNIFPSYEQVKEDLLILKKNWKYLRIYDCSKHAELVLEVIKNEGLDFKVMLGVDLKPEISNPNCPWGAYYSEEELLCNIEDNRQHYKKLISLAKKYEEIIFSVSAGNEATVDWTDHLVPVEKVIEYVRMIKKEIKQPVTFCENYVPWREKLADLVEELDFISLHTYPVWEYKKLEEALDYTKENYYSIANKYPHKLAVITEAGWTTNSNNRGIFPQYANQELQKAYYNQLTEWSKEAGILTFVFEAFDEPWKGSAHPLEPEKHWGLFTVDRKAKKVMRSLYPELIP